MVEVYIQSDVDADFFERMQNAARPVLGTHSGTHHTDEIMACVFLRQLEKYKNSVILRSRDPEILKHCDVVVDVGGEYNPSKLRFDHHQREFKVTFDTTKFSQTRLSSVGLIWYHFGDELIKNFHPNSKAKELKQVIYEVFIECLDAIDNGISTCQCVESDINYRGGLDGLSGLVSHMNVSWREHSPAKEKEGFCAAYKLLEETYLPAIILLIRNYEDIMEEIRNAPRIWVTDDWKAIELDRWHRYASILRILLPSEPEIIFSMWKEDGIFMATAVKISRYDSFPPCVLKQTVYATDEERLRVLQELAESIG